MPEMDCPAEEQQIRAALSSAPAIERLDFDLPQRSLTIWHRGEDRPLVSILDGLNLGAALVTSESVAEDEVAGDSAPSQARVLVLLLVINAVMFVVEAVAGWLGQSTGLLSDSLDMLADAIVYGIALWATGKAAAGQRRAARLSGWFQLALALGMLAEVARRAIQGSAPEAPMMMGVAGVALAANVFCLLALTRHRRGGLHMQASFIFSANDVIANLGVIAAGLLVGWTGSPIPDLVIGALIGLVVLRGAWRILGLSRGGDAR